MSETSVEKRCRIIIAKVNLLGSIAPADKEWLAKHSLGVMRVNGTLRVVARVATGEGVKLCIVCNGTGENRIIAADGVTLTGFSMCEECKGTSRPLQGPAAALCKCGHDQSKHLASPSLRLKMGRACVAGLCLCQDYAEQVVVAANQGRFPWG